MTYVDGGRFRRSRGVSEAQLKQSHPDESHVRKVYALLVYTQMQLGRPQDAMATCRKGRGLFPQDPELRFREGLLLHELGRLTEAVQAYRDVLANREEQHFSSIDRGLTGFKARQNLAVVYTDMGDLRRAEEQWRQVTSEMPHYLPGWRGLNDVLMRNGRHQEARAVAEQCLRDPALEAEGHLMCGRLAMADGDIEGARMNSRRDCRCSWQQDGPGSSVSGSLRPRSFIRGRGGSENTHRSPTRRRVCPPQSGHIDAALETAR